MDVRVSHRGPTVVLEVTGRIDYETAAEFAGVMEGLVRQTEAEVLVDLSRVVYVSSSGLRALLIAARKMDAAGKSLVLSGLNDTVREVFDISGFTGLFRFA